MAQVLKNILGVVITLVLAAVMFSVAVPTRNTYTADFKTYVNQTITDTSLRSQITNNVDLASSVAGIVDLLLILGVTLFVLLSSIGLTRRALQTGTVVLVMLVMLLAPILLYGVALRVFFSPQVITSLANPTIAFLVAFTPTFIYLGLLIYVVRAAGLTRVGEVREGSFEI